MTLQDSSGRTTHSSTHRKASVRKHTPPVDPSFETLVRDWVSGISWLTCSFVYESTELLIVFLKQHGILLIDEKQRREIELGLEKLIQTHAPDHKKKRRTNGTALSPDERWVIRRHRPKD